MSLASPARRCRRCYNYDGDDDDDEDVVDDDDDDDCDGG
jgi:hypothetical protein